MASIDPMLGRRPLGRLLMEMGALTYEQLEQLLAVQRHDGRRLGEIAVSRGLASPLLLLTALKKQKALSRKARRSDGRRPAWKPLGQILLDRRLIRPVQLQQALADQVEDGGFLGELLLERGWITASELVEALSEQIMSATTPGKAFLVREYERGRWHQLYSSSSFAYATDFAFDQVLMQREPQRLAIVHRQGSHEDIVWIYDSERANAIATSREPVESVLFAGQPTAGS